MLAATVLLAFFICQIPVGAIQVEPAMEESEVSIETTVEVTVVGEEADKREETVKHFRMSGGSYRDTGDGSARDTGDGSVC